MFFGQLAKRGKVAKKKTCHLLAGRERRIERVVEGFLDVPMVPTDP